MYTDLFFDRPERDKDIAEQFAEYSLSDLQANLLKLIQTNIVYSYCESLIIEEIDRAEEKVASIFDYCQAQNKSLLYDSLPFGILLKLKRAKNDVKKCDCNRQTIIEIILNLIVENTLLHSSLAKFTYD